MPRPEAIPRSVAGLLLALAVLPLSLLLLACRDLDTDDPVALLRRQAIALETAADLAPLLAAVGDRPLVLLGEASHGTSEFYTWRAKISRLLIEQKDFRFLAVEGDWAACYRLDRYVKGHQPEGVTARDILRGFDRWPTWMWGNEEVADLIEWLRDHNRGRPAAEQVGFYGIDVYGQGDSLRKVLALLEGLVPDLHADVAGHYACLEPFADDLTPYVRQLMRGRRPCAPRLEAAVALLREAQELQSRDPDAFFNLEQNALVVKHAERHYRAMRQQGPLSWNIRVDHFFRTVERLLAHHGPSARGIVWAHNTHIGDASATVMAERGERNIGQIARESFGADQVFAVGFGTHRGTVKAGSEWGAEAAVMTVPPAREDSFEDLLHRTQLSQFLLLFAEAPLVPALLEPVAHRAIGVVYRPHREHLGNYVDSVVPRRYDAFIYIDETRAVRPLS